MSDRIFAIGDAAPYIKADIILLRALRLVCFVFRMANLFMQALGQLSTLARPFGSGCGETGVLLGLIAPPFLRFSMASYMHEERCLRVGRVLSSPCAVPFLAEMLARSHEPTVIRTATSRSARLINAREIYNAHVFIEITNLSSCTTSSLALDPHSLALVSPSFLPRLSIIYINLTYILPILVGVRTSLATIKPFTEPSHRR